MHLHTFALVLPSCDILCTGCDVDYRLATGDEARFVQMTDGYFDGGPMLWDNGVVLVPRNYSIYQEA